MAGIWDYCGWLTLCGEWKLFSIGYNTYHLLPPSFFLKKKQSQLAFLKKNC